MVDSYSGNDSWEKFSQCFDVDEKVVAKITSRYNLEPSVSRVLEWHIGEEYVDEWLNKKIPALEKFRPINLLENYEGGEICIRVVLRRMH